MEGYSGWSGLAFDTVSILRDHVKPDLTSTCHKRYRRYLVELILNPISLSSKGVIASIWVTRKTPHYQRSQNTEELEIS